MSTLSDVVKIGKGAKKIVDAIGDVKKAKKKRLERDQKELKALRETVGQMAALLEDLPDEGNGADAEDLLQTGIDVINAELNDPAIRDDDLKVATLVGRRGALKTSLAGIKLNAIFDTSELMPAEELGSIVQRLKGAQEQVNKRTETAEYVRIGIMVADLFVKVAIAVGKAMA